MKFTKKDLLTRIDQRIADLDIRAEQRSVDSEKAAEKRREDWVGGSGPWLDFAENIKQRVEAGEPIELHDAPLAIKSRDWGHSLNFYVPKKVETYQAQTGELKAMKTAIESVADDVITTAGLKEIGFNNLRQLFG